MNRRVFMVCLVAGMLFGGIGSALAGGGPCKAEIVDTYYCAIGSAPTDGTPSSRVAVLLDRRCEREDRRCRRGNTCQTVVDEVVCRSPVDGDPSLVSVGFGCFCGGGDAPRPVPENPISVDDALELIKTLEDAAMCEEPTGLETAAQ